jgi:alpha-ribazole phosphatase
MAVMVIRHTRVAVAKGVCYGRTDVPLAGTFAQEAAAVRARLTVGPRVVFTSPAVRCQQLAQTLGAGEIRIDVRLWELDFGAWENRCWDDLPRAEVDAWAEEFVDAGPPGGESFRSLAQRVNAFRGELSGENIAVVTHAGVIRAWLCLEEGRPFSKAFERTVEFGECIEIPNA